MQPIYRYTEYVDIIIIFRSKLLKSGIDEVVVDSACYKALYMVELLTKGYHFDAQKYEQIQVGSQLQEKFYMNKKLKIFNNLTRLSIGN